MVFRKLQRSIFLLFPLYVCLVFMGFFAFIFTRDRLSKEALEEQETQPPIKDDVTKAVTLIDVDFNESVNMPGVLNLHVWNDLCGLDVDRVRETPLFPHHPDERLFLRSFGTSREAENYGQRIFGFIAPKVTGLYDFAISSDDTSELWLSFDDKPSNLRLIASVFSLDESAWTDDAVFTKYPLQHSRNIRLVAYKKYFVEVLHKQGHEKGHVKVYWRKPGSLKLEAITGQYLYSYYDDRKANVSGFVEQHLEQMYTWTPSHTKQEKYKGINLRAQFNYTSLPLLNRSLLKGVLPTCDYKPSYIVNSTLKRYEGVKLVHFSSVYPHDNTYLQIPKNEWSQGNKWIHDQNVNEVVDKFMANFQLRQRQYHLQRIINVEENPDPKKGSRYLLELQLGLNGSNLSFRLSEYVFVPNEKKELCFPKGMQWEGNSTVYFVLPVKNQGKWVHHFASQLINTSKETGDLNFHVIIIDFESQDIDIGKVFDIWPLKERFTLINMTGPFYKTLAIQKGVEAVQNENDIVFLYDLHIDVPIGLLDGVRKHTIKGKMTYAPVVGRLDCGVFPSDPKGFWQQDGYGILSVFKTDWNTFGGMNVEEFTTKWGGEDWDLVDRVLSAGLEIERLKQPGLFHYYHSRKGMWQG
ncbi:beta-1,4-N-acetylgalactosaminyltransferase 3-like isoform X2 [Montipora capricornis]|uniref:beta-1,4-N-acetylgalactosaminyltransferase 3-like isoform X2 n=1 Tax=Montipora capricornis TaxID=246305 RepID=UPI0035F1DDC1